MGVWIGSVIIFPIHLVVAKMDVGLEPKPTNNVGFQTIQRIRKAWRRLRKCAGLQKRAEEGGATAEILEQGKSTEYGILLSSIRITCPSQR